MGKRGFYEGFEWTLKQDIFRRYLTAKGTGDVPQQSGIRRHRRRHISVSCVAETTRQITPGLRLWENEGFNEGFEWMLKQHRYFTDISQLKVQVKCSSKALFVATDAAIFLFPVLPSQQHKSRPAYVYGKTRV